MMMMDDDAVCDGMGWGESTRARCVQPTRHVRRYTHTPQPHPSQNNTQRTHTTTIHRHPNHIPLKTPNNTTHTPPPYTLTGYGTPYRTWTRAWRWRGSTGTCCCGFARRRCGGYLQLLWVGGLFVWFMERVYACWVGEWGKGGAVSTSQLRRGKAKINAPNQPSIHTQTLQAAAGGRGQGESRGRRGDIR